MNKLDIQKKIDAVIKEVWSNEIYDDYVEEFLLKEDSLKNALYYHIRSKLSDEFLLENDIRIFTEYDLYNNYRADIAIVKLKPDNEMKEGYHLMDKVAEVLGTIEIKYKATSLQPFQSDIEKVKNYIESKNYPDCQFYLTFICEDDRVNKGKWIHGNTNWIKSNLTILDIMYDYETEYFEPHIETYNNFD